MTVDHGGVCLQASLGVTTRMKWSDMLKGANGRRQFGMWQLVQASLLMGQTLEECAAVPPPVRWE
jgi:hypothetical protein